MIRRLRERRGDKILFVQKEDGTMSSDKEYQVEDLERIFTGATLSPVFRHNPKYPIKGGIARIAYNDIMDYKFIIRHDKNFNGNSFWSEDADVIAEYKSIEELVDDGWRLD